MFAPSNQQVLALEEASKKACKKILSFHDIKKHDINMQGMLKRDKHTKVTPPKETPAKKTPKKKALNRDNPFLYPPSAPARTEKEKAEKADLQKQVQRGSTAAKKNLLPDKPLEMFTKYTIPLKSDKSSDSGKDKKSSGKDKKSSDKDKMSSDSDKDKKLSDKERSRSQS